MKLTEVVGKMNSRRKGTYMGITYVSEEKGYTKKTRKVVRQGIQYGHVVKEQPLMSKSSWYTHNDSYPLSVVFNKKDDSKAYLQVFPTDYVDVKYYVDGEQVSREYLEDMGLYKHTGNGTKPVVITISLDKITELR